MSLFKHKLVKGWLPFYSKKTYEEEEFELMVISFIFCCNPLRFCYPQMSLTHDKRVKGWWPFHAKNEGEEEFELTVIKLYILLQSP